ncbi:MAG: tRNA (N(6)-L-threonylcarbamoyladenosine(37)-C(2))-methylthiotransferase MtaB [Thermodesulfobacteriota bacterium]
MNTFSIVTLGCKVNQFESDALTGLLTAAGWRQVTGNAPADLCIVNTCTVTGRSAGQSRQLLRHFRRENPGAFIIATGCYATVAGGEVRDLECVDCVVSHDAKHKIPEIAARLRSLPEPIPTESVTGGSSADMFSCFAAAPFTGSRARPVLKIQDGCNAFCSYCIVPHARGRSVSMPPDDVLAAVRRFSSAGYPEVVLTGIHLGAYGLDLMPPHSLYRLLATITETGAIGRVRLSSLEPRELTNDILDLAARSGRICAHFHLPLQSGSDAVLKRMNRPYTAAFFKERVAAVKTIIPEAAIGVDVLCGFPGEGDSEFAETVALLNDLPVSYLHVFPFSSRPGTPAAGFPDPVPPAVISERCRVLRRMSADFRERFSRQQKGRTEIIRIEDQRDRVTGLLKGVTANYLTVLVEGDAAITNRDIPVTIGDCLGGLRVRGGID